MGGGLPRVGLQPTIPSVEPMVGYKPTLQIRTITPLGMSP